MSRYIRLKKTLSSFYSQIPFQADSTLWIAVSGGIDSVLLFSISKELFKEKKLKGLGSLGLVHVNHGLRGEESDGDEQFVRGLLENSSAQKSFHRLEWSTSERPSQEACRKKREKIFSSLLRKQDFIALAHHSDDLAETIFMRMMRGTGVDGLLPMQAMHGQRLRPLLGIDRKEIIHCSSEINLRWREDSSNKSNKYERNWIRNELFPLIETRRPGFAKHLNALSQEISTLPKNVAHNEPRALSHSEGISFYRRDELAALSAREIHLLWKLNRNHSFALHEFFQKSSGKFDLPGFQIWNSSALVMKRRIDCELDCVNEPNSTHFKSILGTWVLKSSNLELHRYERGLSSSLKNAFVKARVPAFFRSAIPILSLKEKQVPGIPKNLSTEQNFETVIGKVQYIPSEFAMRLFKELQFEFC